MEPRDRFSQKQLVAIDLLATGTYTQEQVAKEVNVTRKTILAWRKNPEFSAAILDKAKVLLKEVIPALYNVAVEQALAGSHSHLKLIFEHLEKLDANVASTGSITFTWDTPDADNN